MKDFSEDDARYAVENVNIDWNENALISGQRYSDNMAMSKKRIYGQLTSTFDRFTSEEAQYAVDNIKVDWNKNALISAKELC